MSSPDKHEAKFDTTNDEAKKLSAPSEPNEKILELRIEELEKEVQKLVANIQRVERERIEYLQNVSHQIVAPLNAMKWHIENLMAARVSIDRAQRILRSIYSQATIAVHLAKNFRLISNLEG